jgi:DNA (cytosine-5)-methyltransferase 1
MGYHRAGFDIVGVDLEAQPDALTFPLAGFDAYHASPPCQAYGGLARVNIARGHTIRAPKLLDPVRDLLAATGRPYVIENVPGAPMRAPVRLCGSSFGLGVRRHRLFEIVPAPALVPPCSHAAFPDTLAVYGAHPGGNPGMGARNPRAANAAAAGAAMGMDWTDWQGLRLAIPPAYTEWIGAHLLAALAGA